MKEMALSKLFSKKFSIGAMQGDEAGIDCSFKPMGDPVDRIKYNAADYKMSGARARVCKLSLGSNEVGGTELGFDLMSLSGFRGSFIDKVAKGSKAQRAGLAEGDMVVEINGKPISELPHDIVVQIIREATYYKGDIYFKVISMPGGRGGDHSAGAHA